MERRLAAILAADVVGYSRLMEADEAWTLAALKSRREALIDPKIAQYHGRIVKLMGDGLLAEFPSAVEAVQCAIEVQHMMAGRNADAPEERCITYRVGINIGDIVVEDNDIFGDGVNIAARLEGLADPGGICISRSVYTQIADKLDLEFENLGEQKVKNIVKPIMVYRVALDTKAAALVTPVAQVIVRPKHRRWSVIAGAVAVLALTVGGALWWRPWTPGVEPASVERMAFPLPDKPSIAVLPFDNLGGDPEQEYFADGMTDDLITDLSKVSGLFVIARNSSFSYKGQQVKVRQVAEELGVRYVLEGSVRRAGIEVRINAQLIDAATGGHLWADRYDGPLADVFALQDRVTRKIVAVLAVKLTSGEQQRMDRKETEVPEAYDAFLKGWEHYLRQRPDDFGKAVGYFETAVELDPQYARAYAALAATYWQSWKRFWQESVGAPTWHDARFRAEELLEKALKWPTPLAYQLAADVYLHKRQYAAAIDQAERAIALDRNDADSHITMASALSLAGKPEEALQFIERAMRLNPHYPPYYLYELGLAQFGKEQFEDAAVTLEKATVLNPEDRWSLRLLLATYGLLGREKAAARVFQAIEDDRQHGGKRVFLSFMDPLTISASAYWHPFQDAGDAQRFVEGLRNAGVPD